MERLELRFGAARWVFTFQRWLVVMAAACLLFSSSQWPWTAASLFALLMVHLAGLSYLSRVQAPGRLVLHADGGFLLETGAETQEGTLGTAAWISRWLCVVRFKGLETGVGRPCLVCASENRPDDYRRLLVRLRLGQGD